MRLGGAACAIAVFAISGSALAATPAGIASCGPARARTLAFSSRARVYALHGIAYGCAGERQFRLGQLGQYPACDICVGPVRVAGVLTAYGQTFYNYDTSEVEVVVRSLGDGKRISDDQAILISPGAEETDRVASLVLTTDGDVAWIAVSHSLLPSRVRIEVRSGRKVLDSGRTIHPRSLKLHGSLLSWKHGSMTRTARLR